MKSIFSRFYNNLLNKQTIHFHTMNFISCIKCNINHTQDDNIKEISTEHFSLKDHQHCFRAERSTTIDFCEILLVRWFKYTSLIQQVAIRIRMQLSFKTEISNSLLIIFCYPLYNLERRNKNASKNLEMLEYSLTAGI